MKIIFSAEANSPEQRCPDVGTVLVRVPEFDEPGNSLKLVLTRKKLLNEASAKSRLKVYLDSFKFQTMTGGLVS